MGDYKTYQVQARRLQRLSDNLSLLGALSLQRASKNLTSSEKFSLGGPNAVRAYPVAEGSGDEGMVFQAELRYVLSAYKPLGGDLTLMTFWDYGQSKLNRKPINTDSPNYRSIAGYGVGASLGKEGNFLARVSASWAGDEEVPQSDRAPRTPRFWFHAVKYF
jgi:hemolysin activation/secretion protein